MATLTRDAAGAVCLTLRGVEENRILTTLRHWPHWERADIERDPEQPEQTLAVRLFADPAHEDTLRQILARSFGMVFPPEGGTVELPAETDTKPHKYRRKRNP